MILPIAARQLSKRLAQQVTRRSVQVAAGMSTALPIWSDALSFTSPESDFTGQKASFPPSITDSQPSWSGDYSFASPEGDFCAQTIPSTYSSPFVDGHRQETKNWSESLSFATPEEDFTAQFSSIDTPLPEWSHSLSFGSPEADFVSQAEPLASTKPTHDRTQELPRTLSEALRDEEHAIVVTTAQAPHKIVHVNEAWENLCGFSKAEALHHSLDMIQGSKSDKNTAQEMTQRLLKTRQPQEAYLTNYTKDGRAFNNHVTVGPLRLSQDQESDEFEFLVGILEEVTKDEMRRMAAA